MLKNSNLVNLVIVALLVVLILQMCNKRNDVTPAPIIHKDTTWIIKDSTIYSTPQIYVRKSVIDSIFSKEYLPDTNYAKLLDQYNKLLGEYFTSTTYQDSLKIDSIGYVHVKDSISKNLIVNRLYHYSLKYPTVKETITKQAPPVRQLYIGGGLGGNKVVTFEHMSLGLIYKTKKDHLFGAAATLNSAGDLGINLQSYWKIKL